MLRSWKYILSYTHIVLEESRTLYFLILMVALRQLSYFLQEKQLTQIFSHGHVIIIWYLLWVAIRSKIIEEWTASR